MFEATDATEQVNRDAVIPITVPLTLPMFQIKMHTITFGRASMTAMTVMRIQAGNPATAVMGWAGTHSRIVTNKRSPTRIDGIATNATSTSWKILTTESSLTHSVWPKITTPPPAQPSERLLVFQELSAKAAAASQREYNTACVTAQHIRQPSGSMELTSSDSVTGVFSGVPP